MLYANGKLSGLRVEGAQSGRVNTEHGKDVGERWEDAGGCGWRGPVGEMGMALLKCHAILVLRTARYCVDEQ